MGALKPGELMESPSWTIMSQAGMSYIATRLVCMMNNTKKCGYCNEIKSLTEFTIQGARYSYTSTNQYHSYCKKCNAQRAKEWRTQNPNYKGSGRNSMVPKEDRRLFSAIRARLIQAKERIKKYNQAETTLIDMELYNLYKAQNAKCALTGVEMSVEKQSPLCLSLDKKEPELGYTLDNVQWVCWAANRAKGDLSMIDFLGMCECVVEYQKVQRLSKSSES
jgi:hypothetical protein